MLTHFSPSARGVSRLVRRTCSGLAVTILGLGLGLAAASDASAQSLVQNGNFAITGGSTSFDFGGYYAYGGPTNESLANWAYIPSGTGQQAGAAFDFVSGNTGAYYAGGAQTILTSNIVAPGNTNFIAMDANYAPGNNIGSPGISQSISGLTVGASYVLSFSYALTQWAGYSPGGDSVFFTGVLGSASQSTPAVSITQLGGFSGWATATFTYVATATQETLQLLAAGGSGQPPLALIANVSLTKAPEPMSIALFGTGIAALVGVARKRRTPALSA